KLSLAKPKKTLSPISPHTPRSSYSPPRSPRRRCPRRHARRRCNRPRRHARRRRRRIGIYLLIGFLSPMVDPELDPSAAHDGHALPNRGSCEFKHFIRRLPEFKFWYACSRHPEICPLPLPRHLPKYSFF
uniref:Uncharacterized protein n=1 Tax=Aegilops tauschii subsp. strangulata TaxID=200361 RepID=A0A453I1C0_AEGTS